MPGAGLIGGTLTPRGGHTPYEPARHGCALLRGPAIENSSEIFAQLDAEGSTLPVTAETLTQLTEARQAELTHAAAALAEAGADAGWLPEAILATAGL